MIDTAEIIGNLVVFLQDIPDLVEEMGGDETRIYSYTDRYPDNVSIENAINRMPAPGIMVAFAGVGFADGNWIHDVSVFIRAGKNAADPTASGYYRIFRQIVKGIPESRPGEQMQYLRIHDSCDPMSDTPALRRALDSEGIDYFETTLSFKELGDE